MKTLKIVILITVSLLSSCYINAQTSYNIKSYDVNFTRKDNSDESKLISLLNAELISTYKSENIYKSIPKMGTCWMITNRHEYDLIYKNLLPDNSVFSDYNLFILTTTSSGCKLPTAKVGLYSDGNMFVFIKLESMCRNMQFVIVTCWIPKKDCNNITHIGEIRKEFNESI
jgi:hypothetical protein